MLTITPETQFAIEEAHDVFTHNFKFYSDKEPELFYRLCLVYALLQKYKETGEIETYWTHQPCHRPVLNDGYRIPVKTMHMLTIFFREQQYDAEEPYFFEPVPEVREALEAIMLHDMLIKMYKRKHMMQFLEGELDAAD